MAQKTTSPIKLQEHLRGVRYPAMKDDLWSAARDSGAPQEVLDVINELPAEKYDSPAAVMKAFGQVR